jgi:two-component system, chemotaxis family, CheB/CheR fusion protein
MTKKRKQIPQELEIQHKPHIEDEQSLDPVLKKDLTVVGIGASAGGLKALQDFFEALPGDSGLAFVVVTHLAPEHESHMAEILQNRTKMPVLQVNGRLDIEPNSVYVIPPNREIFVADSHLDVKTFEAARGSRTPIDYFFRSLARAHHGAVAIILSGGGADGAVGIKSIKEEGGLLMVQHPDEAEYDSMPRAAIATGLADVVLGVRELARKLMDFVHYAPQVPSDPELLTKEQQDMIQRILAQVLIRTGHDFSQYKLSTILRRVKRRMQLTGNETLEDYLTYIQKNTLEAGSMFNDILIGVTNFFRDPESWQALADRVISAILESKQNAVPIRAWTIGCATGEEAYTLAMLFAEQCDRLRVDRPVQIFASDLDEASLSHAREGFYPAAIEVDVSWDRLERFFNKQGSRYQVKRELRDMVLFANHNVLRDAPFSRLDLVACRNLLIYLQPEMQKNVFDIFRYALNSDGYMFLGSAESADSVHEMFQVMDKEHRIYRVRPWVGQQRHLPAMPLTVRLPKEGEIFKQPRPALTRPEELSNLEKQHRQALEADTPPSILIDQDYQILHLSETAGRYLLQPKGVISADLLKLVRSELHLELRAALIQAFNTGKSVLTKPIGVVFNGHAQRVIISVRLRRDGPEQAARAGKQALVFFLEDESADQDVKTEAAAAYHKDNRNQALVSRLEADVYYLREQLQSVTEEYESSNEEMKAANEELQSINEEYRSATEELETSKEELQSVNEELQTVNNELKSKLDEISRAHSDLENLMGVTEFALLFLDRQLRIHRYTSGMSEIFNLMPSDRGRPITHLTSKLTYTQIVADAERVLRDLVPLEREVSTPEGQWYLVRLRPFRTTDDRIDGVVIGIVDVTALKKAERTQQSYESFYTLFHANPIPTKLVNLEDELVMNANQAFLDFIGLPREQVIGQSASEFKLGLDINSKDRAGLTNRLLKDGSVYNFEEEIVLPSGETKTTLTSIQYIYIEGKDAIISCHIDISERVHAEKQIRRLSRELATAEQEERHRLSQVLHDDLQQRIFAVKMQVENLEEEVSRNDWQLSTVDFSKLERWLAESINITRQLSSDLSPLSMRGEELPEMILWLAAQMKESYELEVEVDFADEQFAVESSLQLILFHALREMLFNVVKHSGVLKAKVSLNLAGEDTILLVVSDAGCGFKVDSLPGGRKSGHGLITLQQRLGLFGCKMELASREGHGTVISVYCPLQRTG